MSTYTQILYQIVFGTKNHRKTLAAENRESIFRYIAGILNHKKCHVYRINGVENHLHIVTHLHPTVALADLIKDIKLASSHFIRSNNLYPDFDGWQDGYGAFTYSIKAKERLIEYVKNQQDHHRVKTFRDEVLDLLKEYGVEFDERYLF
jgi:REP element-mobilizing transposase RayT